jgi:AraC-like DNA-binding protein
MIKKIISYLKEHVGSNLTVDEIKRYSKLSKTSLNVIFKAKTGYSVMEYFKMLKIEEAKSIVREGQLNFTEIAEKLGYQSIHYFSRQFKNISKMSPSEYAISVKAKI